jgi:hypothetical protein
MPSGATAGHGVAAGHGGQGAAEELGAFELAQLWADRTAWPIDERSQYDELSELAVMSALGKWLPGSHQGRDRQQPSGRVRAVARVGRSAARLHHQRKPGHHGRGVRHGRAPTSKHLALILYAAKQWMLSAKRIRTPTATRLIMNTSGARLAAHVRSQTPSVDNFEVIHRRHV